ncbi:hypothetical protein [Streptomyces sp. TS71-3]|uniref:hypothetical protein n=1 Tax=Streptomyces sp. TS71-3 TaxID=2733862 RepID=UPI001B279940|nr:hypothetical protein [Streptomyces sp. TS71-3]GHJ36246.1 hypothetical protein Sm713_18550 [Streptomyces sp. TS71-3]
MKTTLMFRTIANPRRTTLANLAAAEEAEAAVQEWPEQPEHAAVLPAQTANPRRTMLFTLPGEDALEPAVAAPEADATPV